MEKHHYAQCLKLISQGKANELPDYIEGIQEKFKRKGFAIKLANMNKDKDANRVLRYYIRKEMAQHCTNDHESPKKLKTLPKIHQKFARAIKDNDISTIKDIINQKIDMTFQTKDVLPPIFRALKYSNLNTIKTLVSQGNIDINDSYHYYSCGCSHSNKTHMVPLIFYVMMFGSISTMKYLFELGLYANQKIPGYFGNILCEFVDTCWAHVDFVKILLQYGANPNGFYITDSDYCTTALHRAVAERETEIVREFLKHGANPYLMNQFGNDSDDLICEHENKEISDMIKKNINENEDKYTSVPLDSYHDITIKYQRKDMVKSLQLRSYQVSGLSGIPHGALRNNICRQLQVEYVKRLIKSKKQIHEFCSQNMKIIAQYYIDEDEEAMEDYEDAEEYLETFETVDDFDNSGSRKFALLCVRFKYNEALELLLINSPLVQLNTVECFIEACRYGNTEIISWMLNEEIFELDDDDFVELGLSLACAHGNYYIVKLIMERNKIKFNSRMLETPLETAIKRKCQRIVKYLIEVIPDTDFVQFTLKKFKDLKGFSWIKEIPSYNK